MIAIKRTNRHSPIGLYWGARNVSLTQLVGTPGDWEIHAIADSDLQHDETSSSEIQDQAIAASIRKLLVDHRFKGRRVISCLGADELFLQNVRLPQLPQEEVEKVVRWEAEERLPYSLDEAEIRYLTAGTVRQDADIKQEIILIACHQGVINRHLGILKLAGLIPVAVDVEPCAVLRPFTTPLSEPDPDHRQAYLHIGETATSVIFAEGDQILFLKYVSRGGYHLDLAVAAHLNLPLDEASKMRADVTASASLDTDNEIHRSVVDAIREPLDGLRSEIELCLRYFKVTFRGKLLDRMLVTGANASPWLADYLQSSLGCDCEMGDPLGVLNHRPSSSVALERPGRWTAAMGLSMKPIDD